MSDDTELMIARGRYSTANASRKDCLSAMQKHCTALMQSASKILAIANDNSMMIESIRNESEIVGDILSKIDIVGISLSSAYDAMEELRPIAWPK